MKIRDSYDIHGILASHHASLYSPTLIDDVLRCIDTRQGNSTPFNHIRKEYHALKHKMYVDGIGYIYLVYPADN